jgi:hypothetical protein
VTGGVEDEVRALVECGERTQRALLLRRREEPTMDKPNHLNESHPLRDSGGNQVSLEEKCRQLTEECARLRAKLEEVQRERRDYLRALITFMPKEEIRYTKEELLAFVGQKPTLEELIDELEAELPGKEGAGRA